MERYGYLCTADEELDYSCIPMKETRITNVKHSFFKNLKDCINNALMYDSLKEKESRFFFKILKTSDVIEHIYDTSKTHSYGYLYLYVTNGEEISLFSSCKSLCTNMLDCVTSEKNSEYKDSDDHVIKLAYIMLLKDDDILRELHRPYV